MFLDVATADNVDVADYIFTLVKLIVYLAFQRAIEAVSIDLLLFQEVAGINLLTEFFGSEEEVFYTVLFRTTRGTAGGRDGEMEVQSLLHQVIDNGAFTATAGSGEYDNFHRRNRGYRVIVWGREWMALGAVLHTTGGELSHCCSMAC